MKTTTDIPDRELRGAMRFTGAKTKRAAVVEALTDFNRRRRMAALVRHSRSFGSFSTLDSLRKREAGRDKLTGARRPLLTPRFGCTNYSGTVTPKSAPGSKNS